MARWRLVSLAVLVVLALIVAFLRWRSRSARSLGMSVAEGSNQEVPQEECKPTSTGVVGFHLTPPIWVGADLPEIRAEVTLRELQTEVYRKVLASGIKVRVFHCGVFIWDFSDWPKIQDFPPQPKTMGQFDRGVAAVAERVRIMNAYLACLYTSLLQIQGVDHEKMVLAPPVLAPFPQFEPPPEGIDNLFVLGLTRSTQAGTFTLAISTRLRHTFRSAVTEATLERSFEMLDELLGRNTDEALLLPEMLLRSKRAYEDLDYGLSLLLAWAMTEKMLATHWCRYLEAHQDLEINGKIERFISKRRIETLNDSDKFSASVVIEVLSLLGQIPFELYSRSGVIRKRRNDWVHRLMPVTRPDAEAAIKLAEDTLRLVEGIDLPARMRINMSLG